MATEAPPKLLDATVRIAMLSHSGVVAGAVSASVSDIVKGGMRQMLLTQLRRCKKLLLQF